LRDAVQRHLQNVEKKLNRLPQSIPPEMAQYRLRPLCLNFIEAIRKYAEGNGSRIRREFEHLGQELSKTSPQFEVSEAWDGKLSALPPPNEGVVEDVYFLVGLPLSLKPF
jgi:restriction endonuclease